MGDISKSAAGYQMVPNTEYTCGDCVAYDPADAACLYMSSAVRVMPMDGSNYFIKGAPETIGPRMGMIGGDFDGDSALGLLSIDQIGFARSSFGFGCKRCEYFIPDLMDCQKVDKDSKGDTPGLIHPGACCNLHSMSEFRNLPAEAFDGV